AGLPTQTIVFPPGSEMTATIPNNSISSNPIGFVVQPATGASPGTSSNPAVDVTRELLNNLGVELVWLPMKQYVYPACPTSAPLGSCVAATQDFTTLNVQLAQGSQIETCTGFIANT